MGFSVFVCSNCGKELSRNDRDYCSKHNVTECTECRFHEINGTREISEYNKWLRDEVRNEKS